MSRGGRMVFKAFGRLMHRIGHPSHHALRFWKNLWMAWWEVDSEYRGMEKLMNEARHGTAEFFKLLLALTGLPRVYRALDRRRRHKPRLDDLDAHTQEAVRACSCRASTRHHCRPSRESSCTAAGRAATTSMTAASISCWCLRWHQAGLRQAGGGVEGCGGCAVECLR